MSACLLCRERKGKRPCPAKDGLICSQCCGSKRVVEIACPSDCVYLTGAHAAGWAGRETERDRDARRLAPHLKDLSESQGQLFLVAVVGLSAIRAGRRDLTDALALQAVEALRKTLETRERGILYDHQAEDVRAQGLLLELRGVFESRDEEGRPASPDDRDLLPVLLALDGALRAALREAPSGALLLDTMDRVAAQLKRESRPAAGPLIVKP